MLVIVKNWVKLTVRQAFNAKFAFAFSFYIELFRYMKATKLTINHSLASKNLR